MKKFIIQSLGSAFFIALLIGNVQAQDVLSKSYSWDNESEEVTLTMNVKEGTKALAMNFEGKVNKGNLVVTALDPNGNSECGFCLITNCALSCGKARDKGQASASAGKRKNTSSNSSSNTNDGVTETTMSCSGKGYSYTSNSKQGDFGAKGNSKEVISDPIPGEWTFVIEAIKVSGELELSIEQE